MKKLIKEEKVVFIVGILVMVLLIGLGVTKAYWNKNDEISFNENVDTVSLKAKEIILEAGDTFNKDVKSYLKGSDKDIKGFKLDASKVDTKKVGTYTVYFKNENKQLKLIVKVKDSLPPELSVETNSMEWIIDGTGSIEDIKNTIKVKAVDKADGDISNNITGWPETLPLEPQEVTYTLKVKDDAGHESTISFVVRYRVREITPPPSNGGNDNPPQQPTPPADNPTPPEQPDPPVENPDEPAV